MPRTARLAPLHSLNSYVGSTIGSAAWYYAKNYVMRGDDPMMAMDRAAREKKRKRERAPTRRNVQRKLPYRTVKKNPLMQQAPAAAVVAMAVEMLPQRGNVAEAGLLWPPITAHRV